MSLGSIKQHVVFIEAFLASVAGLSVGSGTLKYSAWDSCQVAVVL